MVFLANKANSLAHTKWMCKYHIVFTPKFRRKVIYNQVRKDLIEIFQRLCKYKKIEIIEGHMMARSCASVGKHPTQNQRIKFHGLFERKKCLDDLRETCKFEI